MLDIRRILFMIPATCSIVIFMLLPQANTTLAAQHQNSCPHNDLEWNETRVSSFAVIYPNEEHELGEIIAERFANALYKDYARNLALFGTSLPSPITIRIYPNEIYYHCLNPLVPKIHPESFHTHISWREIVLIADKTRVTRVGWEAHLLNALRHELAIMFVEKVTDGKVPTGLMNGIGLYAQDPDWWMKSNFPSDIENLTPDYNWRELWNYPLGEKIWVDLQVMSIVAFLVDVYGWQSFEEFLYNIPMSEGYSRGLSNIYGIEFSLLQEQWKLYFPRFIAGRWRANVIHGFDLSIFEKLIAGGAYADAAENLREVIKFLENIEETKKLEEAEKLLEIAQLGQEAGGLTRQSRQSLQRKEYRQTIILVDQAIEIYETLSDYRRLSELQEYRQWAQEVLNLQAEVEIMLREFEDNQVYPPLERMIETRNQLASLGDDKSVAQIDLIIFQLENQQNQDVDDLKTSSLWLVLVLILLRMLSLVLAPPSEARLL